MELPLLQEVLEDLDLGVVVCSPGLRRVHFANARGAAALRALGAEADGVPAVLRSALGPAPLPAEHFTPAVEVPSAAPERFFARARFVRRADAVLVVVTAARRRAADLQADLAADLQARLGLTIRQCECAAHVGAGLRNREIGALLGISEGRVEQHLVGIYQQLGVPNRTALAVRLGALAAGTTN